MKPVGRGSEPMTRKFAILLALSALMISGCATAYVPEGLNHCTGYGMCRGGYSESRLAEDTYRVSFQGNARTSRETTQKYLVYRCAEVTLNSGYEYFVFINENTETEKKKYRANAVIKLYRADQPTNNGRAYNAKQVLENLGPEIRW